MQHLADFSFWVGCAAYAQPSCTNEATTKSPLENTIITTSCHHLRISTAEWMGWPAFKVAQYVFWCHKLWPCPGTCFTVSVCPTDRAESACEIRSNQLGMHWVQWVECGTVPIAGSGVPLWAVRKWWKLPFNGRVASYPGQRNHTRAEQTSVRFRQW